ncbi:MAG: hypothetical protein ACR2RA_22275 [Geminicoccaceae bacterium]
MASLFLAPNGHRRLARALIAGPAVLCPTAALAHEAWLLTPDEMAELAVAPIPPVFTGFWPLAGFVVALAVAALGALIVADRLRNAERRLFAPLEAVAAAIGPTLVRLGLALMLGLGAIGGLPRHGTALWTTPTLMVPDMQITLAGGGWAWLAYAELIIALCLLAGVFIRLAAIGVILLVLMGFWAFGTPFLAYGPHFIAPALILLVYGSGIFALGSERDRASLREWRHVAWRVVMALLGGTFVYLGIAYKLNQPTLLIAILDHGDVPTVGLPLEIAALVMMLVEVTAGALLALGLLVRPIALFLIGAFTFFAVTIGETPLFHANLYGAMAMLFMAGGDAPRRGLSVNFSPSPLRSVFR